MVVGLVGHQPVGLVATSGAPDIPSDLTSWFPVERAFRPVAQPDWDGWAHCVLAAVPAGGGDRMVLFGRHGGPEILDSELARLNHLVTLAASIEITVDALS